jgi:hypothetical protein
VRVDNAGDLIFMTYYMVDWSKARQEASDLRCAECGALMNKVEAAVDSSGKKYDGYVCHTDKRLIWARAP